MRVPSPSLRISVNLLKPGLRLAVGVSGGADSVALLLALAERSRELGLVLSVAHLHHGLRSDEADADMEFVRGLAERQGLKFYQHQIDTAAEAAANTSSGKPAESIETAARRLRYAWFRQLMSSESLDAVATAHTLDDQAETVLGKFLRGAWTEGLSGIHPTVDHPEGKILRPILDTSRAEVEAYLRATGQEWREDSTNVQLDYTRNRIRHELLPLLETWNPRLRDHLAQMATLARDEQDAWKDEVTRAATGVLLIGRPVRGGGRAAAEGVAIDVHGLGAHTAALQRRVLRYAVEKMGTTLDFNGTEKLRQLALSGRAGQKSELAQGLRAERTHRELRLSIQPASAAQSKASTEEEAHTVQVPGEAVWAELGIRLSIEVSDTKLFSEPKIAVLRVWKPGDRVHLRHSSGPRRVKEVLERLHVSGSARARWPVLDLEGKIIWMQGVAVESGLGISVSTRPIEASPSQ